MNNYTNICGCGGHIGWQTDGSYRCEQCRICYPIPVNERGVWGGTPEMADEALKLLKSTAQGALVMSERDKKAMHGAMKTIGMLNSMILSGEQHTKQSRETMENAIVDLLHAMQFKTEEPKNGATLGAATHLI